MNEANQTNKIFFPFDISEYENETIIFDPIDKITRSEYYDFAIFFVVKFKFLVFNVKTEDKLNYSECKYLERIVIY